LIQFFFLFLAVILKRSEESLLFQVAQALLSVQQLSLVHAVRSSLSYLKSAIP